MKRKQQTPSSLQPDPSFSHLRPNSAWYCYQTRTRRKSSPSLEQVREGERLAVSDINFVEHETGMNQQSRILEIGCAWGRHSLELARRGYQQVESLDVCEALVTTARERATKAGDTLSLLALDYLDYHTDTPFDIILSLYDRSCLGQPDNAQDHNSLQHLARLLQPGGYLVFGICDWPRDLPLPSRSWEEIEEGFELHEVLSERTTMKCTHRTLLLRSDGSREIYELTRIHYDLAQVSTLLAKTNFQLVSAYHAFDHERPYGSENEGLVVVAQQQKLPMLDSHKR